MSVFRRFKLPQLLRKQKSDENSIVNIPRFDCNALAVKERLGQGSFGDVYTVDYKAPGKVIETYQYKCGGVKAYKKGRGLASGCCPSLKNA